jgi:hypothetical protein
VEEAAMTSELERDLESAILTGRPLEEVVAMLRQYKAKGVTQDEVYSWLEALREKASDEVTEDRILEVADFVAGFCSPHMKIWDG